FFSSRRRHTRSTRDWSSDVCSSDLLPWEHRRERGFVNAFIETLAMVLTRPAEAFSVMKREGGLGEPLIYALIGGCLGGLVSFLRSEERRVGKEWRAGGGRDES